MQDYRRAATPASLTRVLAGLEPEDADRLEQAYQFAAAAHAEHRRDEGSPFIEHPVAVVEILWTELGCRDVDLLVAALNHDVVEDCDWLPREAVTGAIGERAMELVCEVTKEAVPAAERSARDERYLERLKTISHEGKLLKLADRVHNLRSIPSANDPAKARRYLDVSRREFYPLALTVDATAARLIAEACDAIERYLASAHG